MNFSPRHPSENQVKGDNTQPLIRAEEGRPLPSAEGRKGLDFTKIMKGWKNSWTHGSFEIDWRECCASLLVHPFFRFCFLVMLPTFWVSWFVGSVIHFGRTNRSSEALASSFGVCLLLAPGLYSVGRLEARMKPAWSVFEFTGVSSLTCFLASVGEDLVRNLYLSNKAVHQWHLFEWVAFSFLFGVFWTVLQRHYQLAFSGGWLRDYVLGCFLSASFLLFAVLFTWSRCPEVEHLYLHGWIIGYLFALMCRDDEPFSKVCQGVAVGLWLHGAAVWGTHSIWHS